MDDKIIDWITNKQLHPFLNLRREGYDGMDPLEDNVLRSYFGESTRLREATMTFSKKSQNFFRRLRV